jgi:DNA-binding transcriptional LysR family regulator
LDKFVEMKTFVAVVDASSFVRAAEHLSTSKAAVSRTIGDLETRLGVRLLHRTTRKLSLTADGELFFARCRQILSTIDEAESEVAAQNQQAIGLVRVSAPMTFGVLHLANLWGDFAAAHPKVKLEIDLADRTVDLVDEGYDLAVRIAQLPNSSLIRRQLATTRLVLCASPKYLQIAGAPDHPSDLAQHCVIAYSYAAEKDEWHFDGPVGRVSVRTSPRIRTNNGDTCRAGALKHQGLVLQPTFLVGDDLRAGRLIEVMPQYRALELGIYAVYPTRKLVPSKVRLLIDFLMTHFAVPRWPS